MLVPWRVFFGLFIPKTASNEAIFGMKIFQEFLSKEGQHMKHIILGSEFGIICQMGIFTEISLEVGHFSPKVDNPYMEHLGIYVYTRLI